MRILVGLAGIIGLAFVMAPAASAVQQTPSVTFRSAVDLVALEVTVVDRDGRPIPTLKVTDFEVIDHGAPITLTSDCVRSAPLP